MIQREVVVTRPGGVHAQVAQELASIGKRYASSIFLRHQGRSASAGQPISILALALREGVRVTVLADGDDESDALHAVAAALGTPTPPNPPDPPMPS